MVSNYIIKILLRIRPFISIAIIIFSIVLFNHYAGDFQKNMPILIKELNDYIKVLLLFLYIGSVFVILYIVKLMYAYLIILLDKKNLDLIKKELSITFQHPKHIKKIWIKARNENDFLKSSATHLVHLNPMFPLGQKSEIIALYFETFLKQCAELHKYGHKHGIDMFDLEMNDYQIIKLTKQN